MWVWIWTVFKEKTTDLQMGKGYIVETDGRAAANHFDLQKAEV